MRRAAAALLALLLVAGIAGGLAQLRVDTGAGQFLPTGAGSVAATEETARAFGGDPIVVLARGSAPGGLIGDPDQMLRLLRLEGELSALPDVDVVYGPATVVNQLVGSARGLLAQVAGRRDGARAQAEAQARVAGLPPAEVTAAGEDAAGAVNARYAPLVVAALPAGVPTLRNPAFVRAAVLDPDGTPKPRWRFVVPTADSVAVLVRPRAGLDQAGTAALVAAVRDRATGAGLATSSLTVAGLPAVTGGLASAVARDLPLLAALVAVVVGLRFWLVPVAGGARGRSRSARLRAVAWPLGVAALGAALAPAVAGWTGTALPFGAVALLPALLGVGTSFVLYLASARDRRAVAVMGLAAAAGFAALAISPLPFVRDLGLVLGLGMALTVAAGLALRRWAPVDADDTPDREHEESSAPDRPRRGLRAAAAGLAVVAALGWVGLAGLGITTDPFALAQGTPEVADARVVDGVLGSSGEVSVVLRGPDVLSPEALAWSRTALRDVLARHGDRVRPVVSLPDQLAFLGDAPSAEQIRAAAALLPDYLRHAVTTADGHTSLITLGVRLGDGLAGTADLVGAVRAELPAPPPGYTAELAGLPVAAADGYTAISGERYLAGLGGIVASGLVLLVGLRRRSDALRAVAAAVLATGWGYAAMWATGVEPTTVTVALGALVAVSATEFVVLLRLPGPSGAAHRRSVAIAAGTAAVGYAALTASSLWLLRDLGVVLTASVLLAYGAAVLVVAVTPARPRPAPARVAEAGPRVAVPA